jgi:pimeloyl-ACP methyl ester carboxylesterase
MTKTTEFNRTVSSKHSIKRVLKALGILLLVLLGTILFVGLFPVSYRGLDSVPSPAGSYNEAVARYKELEQAEKGIVNESSGSILLTHGQKTPRVYVLVHGITNSPFQWLEYGQMMYERGHNVLIVRMPYHGLKSHSINELKQISPQDLKIYADQVIDIAAGLGDEVYVAGISGGGAVAAWTAENRPEVVRSFLLSPFLGIGETPDFLSTILMNSFSRLPSINTFDVSENIREYAYAGETTRAVSTFLVLGHKVRADAGEGLVPHGKIHIQTTSLDTAASNKSTAILFDLWRKAGADVEADEFGPSLGVPHNSVDPADAPATRQRVYDKMLEFFGEQVSP